MTMTSAAMIPQPPSQPVIGPERPGRPGERGPAVRLGAVELLVGDGDQVHRDEGEQDDRRRLDARQDRAAARDDEPEARREAVRGGGGRGADDDARHQAERAALESLAGLGEPERSGVRRWEQSTEPRSGWARGPVASGGDDRRPAARRREGGQRFGHVHGGPSNRSRPATVVAAPVLAELDGRRARRPQRPDQVARVRHDEHLRALGRPTRSARRRPA